MRRKYPSTSIIDLKIILGTHIILGKHTKSHLIGLDNSLIYQDNLSLFVQRYFALLTLVPTALTVITPLSIT
jgi:hypothetical protein